MSLESIRLTYKVNAHKGVKVEFMENGEIKIGVIVGSAHGSYLLVEIDGRRRSLHPTFNIKYLRSGMRNLKYSLERAHINANETRHAQTVMRELGITYQIAVPQSLYDSWWFFNCENIPDNLPEYITPLNAEIKSLIGHGLSEEDVERLEKVDK